MAEPRYVPCIASGPLVGDETASVGLMSAWVVQSARHAPIFTFSPHQRRWTLPCARPPSHGRWNQSRPATLLWIIIIPTACLHGSEALERRKPLVPGRTGSLHFGMLQHLPIYVDRLLTAHTLNEPEGRSITRLRRPSAPDPGTQRQLRQSHFVNTGEHRHSLMELPEASVCVVTSFMRSRGNCSLPRAARVID